MRYCHIQYMNMTGKQANLACRKTWNAGGLSMYAYMAYIYMPVIYENLACEIYMPGINKCT